MLCISFHLFQNSRAGMVHYLDVNLSQFPWSEWEPKINKAPLLWPCLRPPRGAYDWCHLISLENTTAQVLLGRFLASHATPMIKKMVLRVKDASKAGRSLAIWESCVFWDNVVQVVLWSFRTKGVFCLQNLTNSFVSMLLECLTSQDM